MREYKFRGKTKSHFGDGQGNVVIPKNTWIYGGITYDEDRVWIDTKYHGQIIVDKETVGQFTGLHDKNGKEIYEGDILQHLYDYCNKTDRYIVAWDKDNLQYTFENIHKRNTYMTLEDFYDDYYGDYSIEVIGNIYENRELLKGVDNIE